MKRTVILLLALLIALQAYAMGATEGKDTPVGTYAITAKGYAEWNAEAKGFERDSDFFGWAVETTLKDTRDKGIGDDDPFISVILGEKGTASVVMLGEKVAVNYQVDEATRILSFDTGNGMEPFGWFPEDGYGSITLSVVRQLSGVVLEKVKP